MSNFDELRQRAKEYATLRRADISKTSQRVIESVKRGSSAASSAVSEGYNAALDWKDNAELSHWLPSASGTPIWPFFVRRSTGRLDIAIGNLKTAPVYKAESARMKILDRIRSLPTGTVKATDNPNGWPSIALEEILKADVWAAFKSTASDIKAGIQSGG